MGGLGSFFLCFDSLLFFSGPLRGLFSRSQRALRLRCTLHLCWVFPQAPAQAVQLPSESPGRPRGGGGSWLQLCVPSLLQQALISFYFRVGAVCSLTSPSPASPRWKVLFGLSVASKALPLRAGTSLIMAPILLLCDLPGNPYLSVDRLLLVWSDCCGQSEITFLVEEAH